jgi:hypothetical protein
MYRSSSWSVFAKRSPSSARRCGNRSRCRLDGGDGDAERERGAVLPVRSRFDSRLHYVGSLVPDKNLHGVLELTVPPLASNRYAVAVWCPGCARFSGGRTFHVLVFDREIVPRYRRLMFLRVEMPSAAQTCPVTVPAGKAPPGERPRRDFYDNGTLWTALPLDGTIRAGRHPDGTLRYTLMWWGSASGDG